MMGLSSPSLLILKNLITRISQILRTSFLKVA
ncbi:hypothetical protein [Klebsiella phage RothC]|uniref:Uncharacterized protein n=2 Tax=Viruses TaxID=10239 RepID=A0AB39BYS6_9CAUD